jgi:hypothetical protein
MTLFAGPVPDTVPIVCVFGTAPTPCETTGAAEGDAAGAGSFTPSMLCTAVRGIVTLPNSVCTKMLLLSRCRIMTPLQASPPVSVMSDPYDRGDIAATARIINSKSLQARRDAPIEIIFAGIISYPAGNRRLLASVIRIE